MNICAHALVYIYIYIHIYINIHCIYTEACSPHAHLEPHTSVCFVVMYVKELNCSSPLTQHTYVLNRLGLEPGTVYITRHQAETMSTRPVSTTRRFHCKCIRFDIHVASGMQVFHFVHKSFCFLNIFFIWF